ncbi:phosphonoacetate hydrolase [Mycobacterium sp. 852002-51057_SCH5723018]|uniref:phosphonoacetate hydrolase n=1 Tax=Mycobacterium sp. 852002-51057_SCH5723018 TaxID=1834094 RepID=UPI0007FF1A6B|nr:phosphonoacetate hydrolase [Mycobacterium sp. 852002-51057_SCH5723018]OBG24635.1 phosphonoacetate hydrolase [Mycobacterium sp. 852002-51057_SCH5723018]
MRSTTFAINNRTYTVPDAPVVVICIDGSEPDYHLEAMKAGRMPWLSGVLAGRGSSWPAHCAMPALTNPNNLSIATGQPPAVHGICGNYLFDAERGEEVLMNDKRFLRAPTIFAAANDAGLDVVVVTAKDKLYQLLGAGLVDQGPSLDGSGTLVAPARTGICFSAEKADRATAAGNGIGNVLDLVGMPLPHVYSADLSEFTLAAGVAILKSREADLMYLSLTDYIQHKHAPGTAAANAFYEMIDSYAAQLDALGAIVVLTADHGMSAKTDDTGRAKVLYVEDAVRSILGLPAANGERVDGVRVILPITDPYTVHHGALGSFASVYLPALAHRDRVIEQLCRLDGIEAAHDREDAARTYGLPADRIGDVVVLAETDTALGRFEAWHDLTGLDAPLRSHGALGELQIPFIINRCLPRPDLVDESYGLPASVHNYDAFWVATTLVVQHQSDAASAV